MLYERNGRRFRATGRDFWYPARRAAWIAVWRTMFDVQETDA
jgi:hypothetical protein